MQLNGMIRSTCPPERLATMLNDPAVLTAMMPAGSDIRQTETGAFAFTIHKSFGPIRLNMPGTLTVTPLGASHDRRLTAQASHLIGGKVDVALDIRMLERPAATVVTYEGQLTASGLANRVLGDNVDRAQNALRGFFMRLKRLAEGENPAVPNQGTAARKA